MFGVLFLPGSHEVIACGESNFLAHCHADTGQLLREIKTPFERVIEFMTLSPDLSRLLMAGADGQVVQMKLDDFSVVCQREVSQRTVTMARYPGPFWNLVSSFAPRKPRIFPGESMASPPCRVRADGAARLRRSAAPSADGAGDTGRLCGRW